MNIRNPNPTLSYQRHVPNKELPKPGAQYVTGWGWTEPVTIAIGDVVAGNGFNVLASGSGVYPVAVCMSTDPFVLVSEAGDMVWSRVDYHSVHVVGRATAALMMRCRLRLQADRRQGQHYNTDAGRGWLWQFLHRDPQRGRNLNGWFPNWMRGSIVPDFVIGGWDNPYIYRWFLWPRLPVIVQLLVAGVGLYLQHPLALLVLLSPYLHVIRRSDDDRALHDHPAANLSIILSGGYTEVVPDAKGMKDLGETTVTPKTPVLLLRRRAGDVILRMAKAKHRLVIEALDPPAVTLFVFGIKHRDWGFWCAHGFRHWLEFTGGNDDPGHIGRGCD